MKNGALLLCVWAALNVYAEPPLIVAHRGASVDAPENTLAAFKLAWAQGADAIEADFRQTADGVIVCIHDADTERVANTNLVVSQSTLAQLQQLDVGAYRGEAFKGMVIPTLAEVLSAVPEGKKIFIEVKCGPELVLTLLEEIEKSELQQEQIVVISFKEKVIEAVKTRAPHFRAHWLCSFKKDKSGALVPTLENVLESLKQAKADGLSSNGLIPESVLEGVRKRGYDWHIYTINDLETAQRVRAWGPRSITTDVPGIMKKHFEE